MANKIFHIKARQFPNWFRAAIAIAALIAFYGFIWSLVRPKSPTVFELGAGSTAGEAVARLDAEPVSHRDGVV